jgi:hypothetical protein
MRRNDAVDFGLGEVSHLVLGEDSPGIGAEATEWEGFGCKG